MDCTEHIDDVFISQTVITTIQSTSEKVSLSVMVKQLLLDYLLMQIIMINPWNNIKKIPVWRLWRAIKLTEIGEEYTLPLERNQQHWMRFALGQLFRWGLFPVLTALATRAQAQSTPDAAWGTRGWNESCSKYPHQCHWQTREFHICMSKSRLPRGHYW